MESDISENIPIDEKSPQNEKTNDSLGIEPQHAKTIPVKKDDKLLRNKLIKFTLFLILVILLLVGGIQIYLTRNNSSVLDNNKLITTGTLSGDIPKFADYKEEKVEFTPSLPAYTLSIDELVNLNDIQEDTSVNFSDEQKKQLTNRGFFFLPAENKLQDADQELDFAHGDPVDEFVLHYKEIGGPFAAWEREAENTIFITSDYLLHTYHVFVDRTFQYIEETQFHPKLLQLTDILYDSSLQEYQNSSDPKLKESFARLTTFYLVPKVILETSLKSDPDEYLAQDEIQEKMALDENIDSPENIVVQLQKYKNELPDGIYTKALEEIELINKSEGMAISPLFGKYNGSQIEDYSQFKPRSHYTKNSSLRSFWKAMIWYGRNGFLTKSDELTLDAINQTLLIGSAESGSQKAIDLWEDIYFPTIFFVGKSDDLTFYDFNKALREVYGDSLSFNSLKDADKFNLFKENVKEMSGPTIQSSIIITDMNSQTKDELLEDTKSFRFMGQRYIPDSFIYSELTQGDEAPDTETGQKLPPIPTSLMPMSIFGSERAEQHLNEWIKREAAESDLIIAKEKDKLNNGFSKLTAEDWTQNMYWSWLYTLKSLFNTYSDGYPMFMRNTNWNDKDLISALGSYSELRHDTLLYAKQSYAELGGGQPPPEPNPVPKGYVEPNIELLNRLIALAKYTKAGLENSGVLTEEPKAKLESLIETYTFFREISVKQLQNEQISDEDFDRLRLSYDVINRALIPPSTWGYMQNSDARSGIMADIHTAVTSQRSEVLYQGTGIPYIIYVAVKDINGTRLTRGVTYSYYEFTHPFGERLSDQDWQANIYEGASKFETPQEPFWTNPIR